MYLFISAGFDSLHIIFSICLLGFAMSCIEVVPFSYSVNLLLAKWMLCTENVAQCMSHNGNRG